MKNLEQRHGTNPVVIGAAHRPGCNPILHERLAERLFEGLVHGHRDTLLVRRPCTAAIVAEVPVLPVRISDATAMRASPPRRVRRMGWTVRTTTPASAAEGAPLAPDIAPRTWLEAEPGSKPYESLWREAHLARSQEKGRVGGAETNVRQDKAATRSTVNASRYAPGTAPVNDEDCTDGCGEKGGGKSGHSWLVRMVYLD